MNNPDRTANYLRQNVPALRECFEGSDGTTIDPAVEFISNTPIERVSAKLTPAQRRRIKHKRGPEGAHRQRQRVRRREQLMRQIAHWSELAEIMKGREQ